MRSSELEAVQTGVEPFAEGRLRPDRARLCFSTRPRSCWRAIVAVRRCVASGFPSFSSVSSCSFPRGGGHLVVDSLSEAASSDAAVSAVFDIGTSLLLETAQSIVAYGIVIVLAAWLAGPTRWAISIRHALTPYLRRPGYAYGGLAVLLVLVFWWDPVIATHRLVPSLLLIAFAVLGTELLRRQVIREFPDHVTPGSPGGAGGDRRSDPRAARRDRRRALRGGPARRRDRAAGRAPRLGRAHQRGIRRGEDAHPRIRVGRPSVRRSLGATIMQSATSKAGRQPELTVPESADRPWSGSRASVGSTRRQRSARGGPLGVTAGELVRRRPGLRRSVEQAFTRDRRFWRTTAGPPCSAWSWAAWASSGCLSSKSCRSSCGGTRRTTTSRADGGGGSLWRRASGCSSVFCAGG